MAGRHRDVVDHVQVEREVSESTAGEDGVVRGPAELDRMGAGREIFDKDDPKYFRCLATRAKDIR